MSTPRQTENQKRFSNGPELVLEAVYGIRGFRCTEYNEGTLIGQRLLKWSSGVNVAKCRNPSMAEVLGTEHYIAHPSCTCGFYGYWKIDSIVGSVRLWSNVLGIIEGTGKASLGDYGFRAERAKIVALSPAHWPVFHIPGIGTKPVLTIHEEIRAHYPAAAWFSTPGDMLAEFPTSYPNGLSV